MHSEDMWWMTNEGDLQTGPPCNSKAALPLIFASLLALVVIIIFPDLSTFVPRMLGQM